MFIPRSSNFIDISNIDTSWIVNGVSWIIIAKTFDYTWKRLQIPLKSKQFYFGLRGLKYQFLYKYEGLRISRKRKGPWFMNHEMSKIEKHYFCQMLLSDMRANPDQAEKGWKMFYELFRQTYPEKFREMFGESKSAIQARLNIEKFFQNVFA